MHADAHPLSPASHPNWLEFFIVWTAFLVGALVQAVALSLATMLGREIGARFLAGVVPMPSFVGGMLGLSTMLGILVVGAIRNRADS